MRLSLKIIALAVITAICAACEHKTLIRPGDDYALVTVAFDWQNVEKDEIPDEMILYFYGADGSTVVRKLPTLNEEQTIVMPRGVYTLIAHNDNAESMSVSAPTTPDAHTVSLLSAENDLVSTIYGRTTTGYVTPSGYPLPLSVQPERVVAAELTAIDLTETMGKLTITVRPQRVTARYDVVIKNFNVNRKAAEMWGAALTGMNATLMPQQTLHTDHCVPNAGGVCITIPFRLSWPEGSTTATSTFYTYGAHAEGAPQLLHLYVWGDNSSCLSRTYDVTEAIRTAPNPKHVQIIINFSKGGEDPFSPDEDEWEDVDEIVVA